jgi:cellulose synthase/poly-beta-1,6-N-acetylglucosamine synthase-like glycosyltransferase
MMNQPRSAVDPPVGLVAHLQGVALLQLLELATLLAAVIQWSIIPIGVLTVARALLLVALAWRHTKRPTPVWHSRPVVTVVIPAYNEEIGITATVSSIAASDYPNLEIIVVDDGSTDATAQHVRDLKISGVTLVTQHNAGKPRALNTGIAAARGEIIVMVDGDTVFEPDTVTQLVQPFADETVGAVSGNTKVGNRTGLLGRWQHVEYVLGFNLDRRMYDVLRCMPTVPGAIGAFRRSVLAEIGGVSEETLAEDTDLTMAVNRAGYHVAYGERARAWTEAPFTLRGLWRQRYRWCYGTMQAMWKHKDAVRERARLGLVALPYLLAFQVVLPLIAPLIDLYAIYGIIFLDPIPVIGYWIAFNIFQILLGAYAFRLDRERLRPLWSVPIQQFVYRQLMYLVVYQSILSAIAGSRLRWHKLTRVGVQLPDQ